MLSKHYLGLGCALVISSVFWSSHSLAAPAASAGEVAILSDIAAINKNEILLGDIAANKKSSADVLDFAKMMLEQHGNNLTQVLELANTLQVKALNSGDASKMAAKGNEAMLKLGGLQGEQFDKAYIDAMVKGHEEALKLIDDQLMKQAKTESVKTFLSNTRAAVVQHLEKAKQIQGQAKS